MDADLATDITIAIGFFTLIAAAAALTWQRRGVEGDELARRKAEEEEFEQLKLEAKSLTNQNVVRLMASQSRYARLKRRIEKLLKTDLDAENREMLSGHLSTATARLLRYGKALKDAGESLIYLETQVPLTRKSKQFLRAKKAALVDANTAHDAAKEDDADGIEADVGRVEAKVS